MKSLKRTLSLVLALVMVLGLFGGISMTAAASDFTDDEEIQYKEAVDVMTGIGAIDGMGDGTFQPDGKITRAQAAKLVAYTILGKEAADRLTGLTTDFSDVPADMYDWAVPSIAYLTQAGIINGLGDGTFNPEGKVTGYEIGKMLLCALGYGAKNEFTGDGWKLQVAIYGNRLGNAKVGPTANITTGRLAVFSNRADDASDLDSAASREEVALYCFNTIQKEKVEYISTLDIYSNDQASSLGLTLGTIASNVYPKLTCDVFTSTGKDALGNPANVWTYKGDEIGAYAVTPIASFTTAQTKAALTSALKGYKKPSAAKHPFVNNKEISGTNLTEITDIIDYLKVDDTPSDAMSGNGVSVKIYANDDKEITHVIVEAYDLTKVSAVNTAGKSVTLNVVKTIMDPAKTSYKITEAAQPELYAKVSDLEVGDYVLVTPVYGTSSYDAGAVTIPTELTGKIARVNTATGVMTFEDGTACATAKVNDFNSAAMPDIGNDVTVLQDSMGNVVHWKAATTPAATETYGFVLDSYQALEGKKVINMATVAFTDGEIKDVPAEDGSNEALEVGRLYKLEDKTDTTGEWLGTIVGITVGGDLLAAAPNAVPTGNGDKPAPKGVLALIRYSKATTEAAGSVGANDKTLTIMTNNDDNATPSKFYNNFYDNDVKFIFLSKDEGGNWSASVSTGVTACDIPKYDKSDTDSQADTLSYAVIDKASKTDSTLVVKAMFINNGEKVAASDPSKVLFIPDVSKPTAISMMVDGKEKTVYNYKAFVDGEPMEDGVTIANKGKLTAGTGEGFYMFAESTTIKGAYDVTKLTTGMDFAANNLEGIEAIKTHHAPNFNFTDGSGTATSGLVNLKSAKIVDLRSEADQADIGITATVEGLYAALVNHDLTVAVLYDASKGNLASVAYICDAGDATELTMPTSCTDGSNKLDASFNGSSALKWSVAKADAGSTVTLTVKIGTEPSNAKLVATFAKCVVTGCSVNGTALEASAITTNGTVVEIPKATASQGKEVTFTIWLNDTSGAPTLTVTDVN